MDFADFPPAKGRIRTPLCSDGQLLLVQVDNVAGAKKLIPDFPTWAQCFAIFAAVLGTYNPALLLDLMTYLSDTATHAKRFKWPSWVIQDQNFWQDLASKPGLSWARVDATIYAQCFTNMASNPPEAWCRYCYGIDHVLQSPPGSVQYSRLPRSEQLMPRRPTRVNRKSAASTIHRRAAGSLIADSPTGVSFVASQVTEGCVATPQTR